MVICNTKLLSARGFFCGLAVRSFFVNIVRWLKEPHKNFPPQGCSHNHCLFCTYFKDRTPIFGPYILSIPSRSKAGSDTTGTGCSMRSAGAFPSRFDTLS